MRQKFYSLKNILAKNAQYNVIFGERSNGKTYSVLKYGLSRYAEHGEQLAIVRRWQDDFTGKRGATMFDALVSNDEISRATGGEWTGVYYYGSRWFLCRYEDITDALYDRDRLVEVDWDIQTWCELPERENPYKNMRLPPRELDRHRQYVYPTLNGTFRILKTINGVKKSFGTYKSLDEALDKRDELIKRGWKT